VFPHRSWQGWRVQERRRRETVYLSGAIAVRLVTEGVGVALVLVAAVQLHSVALGGVLLACLTAPSVLAAPIAGALLDAARRPKRVLLGGAALMSAGLLVAAAASVVPLPVVIVALLAAGCALPMFVGGLSAFVEEVMPGDRARGTAIDALSYNLAGIGGPAVVAGMSALLTPSGALVALAVVLPIGALLLQLLPIAGRGGSFRPAALARGIAAAMRHLTTHGPLARVVVGGTVVQIGGGMLPVVAVLVAVSRGQAETAGGVLLTAFSLGGVVGALSITVPAVTRFLGRFPARRVMAICFSATGVGVLLAAVLPGFPLAAVALALAGLTDGPGLAAMLRARSEESPPPVRAQVFVVAGGLRVAAAALGSAIAGALAGFDPSLLLVLIAASWVASAPILLLRRPGGRAREAATPAG
jgi:MFS family permease